MTEIWPGCSIVSSGLGGMSGAQPKAAEIAGAVSMTAEVDLSRIETRREQGWVQRVTSDLGQAFSWAAAARAARTPLSIAYHGNIVDLWQYAVDNEYRRGTGFRPDLLPRRLRGRLRAPGPGFRRLPGVARRRSGRAIGAGSTPRCESRSS